MFDGAYLWEEYIWTILKELKELKDLNFKHPENRKWKGKGGINLLINNKENKKLWKILPDFYSNDKKIVLDTKYKRLNNNLEDKEKNINREDRFQLISYVYTLGAKIGGFIYPCKSEKFGCKEKQIGILNKKYNENILKEDYSFSIYKYGFLIPNINFNNIKEFSDEIKKSEEKFKEIIMKKGGL